jgi:hypothetical protein
MKVEEIKEAPVKKEEEEVFEGDDDDQENLTEALSLIEDCVILLDAFSDPKLNPRWERNPKFLRHNLLKIQRECQSLLNQYDLSQL